MSKETEKQSNDHEAICRRCGRCCYEKVDFEGQIYYTELPCEFLDITTNHCRVYGERDVQRPGCVRLTNDIIAKGILPADCPYVTGIENYPAPNLFDDSDSDDS